MVKKIKHKITASNQSDIKMNSTFISLLKQAVLITLRNEQVDTPCEISILITNNAGIRDFNKRFRGFDESTDVLAFPMQEFEHPGWGGIINMDFNLETGNLPLGDIVISLQKVMKNIKIERVTLEQESTLLMIHAALHLLGYDHYDEETKHIMQRIEKGLMRNMGYLDYGKTT
ncbi:MAG: rRNA maturation RNase YbeY [Oscillospiraceae bacterium]|jgi:probable rRNA maturation factor|nr:rRNA maturation RNase YbeY [Oscillospiraceae bacterium]